MKNPHSSLQLIDESYANERFGGRYNLEDPSSSGVVKRQSMERRGPYLEGRERIFSNPPVYGFLYGCLSFAHPKFHIFHLEPLSTYHYEFLICR